MKMKLSKILFLIILLFSFSVVKADWTAPMVDTNYNTVYRGDLLDFSMGFDYKWFEGIVKTDKKYNFVFGDRFEYKMESFYFSYDNTVFEFDFSDMQVLDEDYVLLDYYKKTYDKKTFVIFDFDIRNNFGQPDDPEGYNSAYNGIIDNMVLSNIKFKVKDKANFGTYFIESDYFYDENGSFDDFYANEYSLEEHVLYPITIISNEKTEDSISDVIYKTYIYDDEYVEKTSVVDILPNKFDYNLEYFNADSSIELYAACNSRCKLTGIGDENYTGDLYGLEIEVNEVNVKYSSGKTEKYSFVDEYSKASIDHYYWTSYYDDVILVIGSSNSYDVSNYVYKFPEHFKEYKKYYYDYDELNSTDKKILNLLKADIDVSKEPFICRVINGKIYTEYSGFVEDNEWEPLLLTDNEKNNLNKDDYGLDEEVNNNNSVNQDNSNVEDIMNSLLKDRMDELEIKYDYSSLDKFIVDNYNIVLICLTTIISLLFVFSVILLIKNIKLKKALKNKTTN